MSAIGCYECSQKNGHAATGWEHPDWWCKRDLCPDREKHYEQVYGSRVTTRYGNNTRDGVMTYTYIDGKKTDTHYRQERCICGLYLIFTPKQRPKGS